MGLMEKIFGRLMSPAWGVHPDDHKRPAADAPVRVLPMPELLHIPLQQHVGGAARPVVVPGQRVFKGQLIAEPNGRISAPVHASTSGTIRAIGEVTAPHPSGLALAAIIIEADGRDEALEAGVPADPFALSPAELTGLVAAAGVVGLGGATFPSSVKLALGKRSEIKSLIVNGGECEPYLSCDDRVMRDHADQVIDGVRLMLHCCGAQEALVGIENNKPEAIAAMSAAAKAFPEIKIRPVPSRYPMGSDRQLIQTLTGKEVPTDCRAADVGVLVNNVNTAAAVHRAVRLGEPLIRRIVTVNGGAVRSPGNFLAPIGALARDLFAFAGLRHSPARLVMGGPMMGTVLPNALVPVVKGTAGFLALTQEEVTEQEAGACIRCGNCTTACPQGLLPVEMAAHVRADDLTGAEGLGLVDCLLCGCCAYVCPAHIPLVQYFNHARGELWSRERTKLRQEATKRLASARAERVEREAKEKAEAAARRKAERDAAKKAAAAAAPSQEAEA